MSTAPPRAGKIIAVHLSYASRADQRGRRPAHPSYFLKPTSSIGTAGGTVERPLGTELLAFEGEIALIMGYAARRVPLSDAWNYVGWVTAANDFGLYDLRAADKGSNVRSKGGDGFTPIGPGLIDARTVDPGSLRVRTWVNDALVQEDTTAGLLFPLAQFVADLSQHFTLHPGDVILTGTPAGSSVVVPGDVVDVEVDAPGPGVSTGKLRTFVAAGTTTYDGTLGDTPSADDAQRIAAFGSAQAAGLPDPTGQPTASTEQSPPATEPTATAPTVTTPTMADGQSSHAGGHTGAHSAPEQPVKFTLTDELRAKLVAAPLASLSSQLRKRGLNHVSIDGVAALPGSGKLVGIAATLRFVPLREDLFSAHGGGYNAQKQAFDALREGEVMVIEARGVTGAGTLGDVLALRAKSLGAAGIVTDGAVRDHDAVAAVGIPVYSNGSHPAVLGRRHVPWDHGITVSCGGTTVQPGDVIVGDADGVLVIPPALAAEVADAALAQEDSDGYIAARVAEGERLEGLFPMNDAWLARYAQSRGDGEETGA